MPSGCSAKAGYSGTVTATTTDPFYAVDNVNGNPVTAVQCPPGTSGNNVPTGCQAQVGATGIVTATTIDPHYAIDGVNGGTVVLEAGYSLVDGVVTGTSVESVLRVLRSCFTRFPPRLHGSRPLPDRHHRHQRPDRRLCSGCWLSRRRKRHHR